MKRLVLLALATACLACGPKEAAPPPVAEGLNLTVAGQAANHPVQSSEVWAVVGSDPEHPSLSYVIRGQGATLVVPFPPGQGHTGTSLRWSDLQGKDLSVAPQGQGPSTTETSRIGQTPVTGGSFRIEAVEGTSEAPVLQGRVDLQTAGGNVPGTFRLKAPSTTSD